MTEQDAATLIRACSQLWPTVPLQAQMGPDMVRLWALTLVDVTLAEAELAIVHAARQGDRFPPTPGVIARTALDARARTAGALVPTTDEAWGEIMEAVRARGWYIGPPTSWSHPAVATAAQAIGWADLCHGDEMVTRAHFLRMYPALAERAIDVARADETATAFAPLVQRLELEQ